MEKSGFDRLSAGNSRLLQVDKAQIGLERAVALRELPIIMITSRIAEKHREHAKELGVNHYLGKPYSDEELLSLIRHYARLEATAEA